MFAYLTKTKTGYILRLLDAPANGPAFQNAKTVEVENKKAARAYCKAHNVTPHNF